MRPDTTPTPATPPAPPRVIVLRLTPRDLMKYAKRHCDLRCIEMPEEVDGEVPEKPTAPEGSDHEP